MNTYCPVMVNWQCPRSCRYMPLYWESWHLHREKQDRDRGRFVSCIYGVQSGYERVRKAVLTNRKKTLADENYTEVLSTFCALFLQMQAFKNGNARLPLGFLSVRRFDIPVIVTMNDKYSMRLLCGCHQEVVLCLSFWPTTDKLRSRGGDLIARRLM